MSLDSENAPRRTCQANVAAALAFCVMAGTLANAGESRRNPSVSAVRTVVDAALGQPADPLPEVVPSGFTPIFDGKTLTDWDGDPKYWSVQDDILVGTVTPDTLLKENSWIVWRGGVVEDFELVLDYRVSPQGNSGVGYRLAVVEGKPFAVRGPQADIHGPEMFTGICYEENGRRLLSSRGQATWIDAGGKPRVIAQFAHPGELQALVRKEDWNRYRLVVRGRHAQHFLNGVLMSEVHDHDEANQMHRGLVGVQVHVGPPMTIEFRNLYLKHLGPAPTGDAGRVNYRPGSRAEFEHPPTFRHLEQQAARLTAAAPAAPLDGRREPFTVTGYLARVRHDLIGVPLLAASQPRQGNEAAFDLVVVTDNDVFRVPHAGGRIEGRSPGQPHRVRLQWDGRTGQYAIAEISDASGK
jgi:hypothetical protein